MSELKGLQKAKNIVQNKQKKAQELKDQGNSLIGYICCFAPPEIIYAAGAIPYRITGKPSENVSEVDAYLEPYGCPYVRNCFGQYLKGRLDFLDGLVIPHSCDMVQRLYGIWTYYHPLKYNRMINVPHQLYPWSRDFYRRELWFFKESLEVYMGQNISSEAINDSIILYNRLRKLIRELYKYRGSEYPFLRGSELMETLVAGEILPPEEFEKLLEEALEEIKKRKMPLDQRERLLVWGSIQDHSLLFEIIEQAGGLVVADDTCLGMRLWNEDILISEDPYQSLEEYYFYKFQCPRTDRGADLNRFEYIRKRAENYNVQGIICYIISFCDPHKLDYPDLRDYMEKHGYPTLLIDDNYNLQGVGGINTRIQAFMELLQDKSLEI